MRSRGVFAAVVVCGALAGCGGGSSSGGSSDAGADALEDLESIAVVTSSLAATFSIASAPNVYAMLAFPMLVATASTGGCPVVSQDENGTTVTGGCTDGSGTLWSGEMRMLGFSEMEIELDSFSFASATSCNGFSLPGSATFEGRAHVITANGGVVEFEQDFTLQPNAPCGRFDALIAVDYEGIAVNGPDTDLDGVADDSTWSGSGRVGIEGIGRVGATTEDERLDGVSIGPAGGVSLGKGNGPGDGPCYIEPASGVTRFRADGVTTELSYDGATACDASVPWSIDGTPQFAPIVGVSCSASAERGRSAFEVLALFAIVLSSISVRRPAATSRSSR